MVLGLLLAAGAVRADVLFFDDFESGMSPQWNTPDGGWVLENGHLSVTSSCGFQQCNPNLYAGGEGYAAYLVSFDFSVTAAYTGHGSGVGCYVALSNPVEPFEGATTGYSLGCGWSADGTPAKANCQIQVFNGSSVMTEIAYDTGSQYWITPGVVYHMVLGRVGSSLVFKKWADGETEPGWLVTVDDTSHSAGYWMPIFWHNIGWIDNFKVEGLAAVPVEAGTWGEVKALFR
jgi:hypothetical protein